MKIKLIRTALLFCSGLFTVTAQESSEFKSLNTGKIEPYKMEVTYNKTSHILFPAAIRYVDLGSDKLVANKTDEITNVLRIKASVNGFEDETNFSVITEDGKFYSFDVFFSGYPDALNYDIEKMHRNFSRGEAEAHLTDLDDASPMTVELIMNKLLKESTKKVHHLASKSFGIRWQLTSFYSFENKLFFVLELGNKSNLPFETDFVSFKIVDKKILRKTVVQEIYLKPLREKNRSNNAAVGKTEKSVFLLNQFPMDEDQVLEIQIFEKDGARHQKIIMGHRDLSNIRPVSNINFKL